jgi:hypothetical protein
MGPVDAMRPKMCLEPQGKRAFKRNKFIWNTLSNDAISVYYQLKVLLTWPVIKFHHLTRETEEGKERGILDSWYI